MSAALSLQEEQLLRMMMRHEAKILTTGFDNVYPVHPKGRKRQHPVCWVEPETISRLLGLKLLEYSGVNLRVNPHMAAYISGDRGIAEPANQAVPVRETELEPGLRGRAQLSELRKLERRQSQSGEALLSAAQIEAGEQFARDYLLSRRHTGLTRDYGNVRVDMSDRAGRVENSLHHRIDRNRRLSEATSCLTPRLERIIVGVCCDNQSLDRLERAQKWPRHSAIMMLQIGLELLAQFYGTKPGEEQP